jgi:hypothetical protein|tara:strand:+ start:2332 stop:2667 length:336 start_codon:yes stop_codon:yes gene_type:complete
LVVSAGPRHHQCNGRSLRAAASATGALLIVRNAWRDVPAENRFQLAQIDTHFHCRGAAEQVDFTLPEPLLDLGSFRRRYGGGVLPSDPAQRLPFISNEVMVAPAHLVPFFG